MRKKMGRGEHTQITLYLLGKDIHYAELAQHLGVSEWYMSNMMRGKRTVTVEQMWAIKDYTGMSISEMLRLFPRGGVTQAVAELPKAEGFDPSTKVVYSAGTVSRKWDDE